MVMVMLTLQMAEVIDIPSDGNASGCDDAVGITALMMMMMIQTPGIL